MQELVIVTTCDLHTTDGSPGVPASEYLWYVNDTPWVLDMCDEHSQNTTLNTMDSLVRGYGRPLAERRELTPPQLPKKKRGRPRKEPVEGDDSYVADVLREKRQSSRVDCPYPECGRDYKNKSSLASHFTTEHGVAYSTWMATQEGVEPSFFCFCGSAFITARSLGSHIHTTKTGEHYAVDAA